MHNTIPNNVRMLKKNNLIYRRISRTELNETENNTVVRVEVIQQKFVFGRGGWEEKTHLGVWGRRWSTAMMGPVPEGFEKTTLALEVEVVMKARAVCDDPERTWQILVSYDLSTLYYMTNTQLRVKHQTDCWPPL